MRRESRGTSSAIPAFDQSEASERLDELHRWATLGLLSAMAMHELNNLLTPVANYAKLALASPGDTQLAIKALHKSAGAADRAKAVLATMLAARGEEGASSCANVRDAIDDALHCLPRRLDRDSVTLIIDVSDDLNAGATRTELRHILLNLILNARDAAAPGRGEITIRARRSTWNTSDQSHPAVELIVEDTGPGIPDELIDTIFQPGVTSDDRTKRASIDEPHAGLGLTIVRSLAERCGGGVHAENRPEGGARFTVRLPLAGATAATRAA